MHAKFKYKKTLKDNKHRRYISIAPKENKRYIYLSTTLLDFILVHSNNEYSPQIFLEECLYAMNKEVLDTNVKILSLDEYVDKFHN